METVQYPVESLTEKWILQAILPELHQEVGVQTQRPVVAGANHYRVDLCLWAEGRMVVVESDSQEYHDYRRDEDRDINMLTSGGVTDIIRLRAIDIMFNREMCVLYIKRFFPFLFDPSKKPHDSEEMQLLGSYMDCDKTQPIVRTSMEARGRWLNPGTATILGAIPDERRVLMQFKSPYWGWSFKGVGIWQIGDLVESRVEALAKEAGKEMPPRVVTWQIPDRPRKEVG